MITFSKLARSDHSPKGRNGSNGYTSTKKATASPIGSRWLFSFISIRLSANLPYCAASRALAPLQIAVAALLTEVLGNRLDFLLIGLRVDQQDVLVIHYDVILQALDNDEFILTCAYQ